MKYLLVPMKETTASSSVTGNEVIGISALMNFITGIIISIMLTSDFLPNLHGFGRFALCIAFSLIFTTLGFFPIIGGIICIGCGVVWCIFFWKLFDGIGFVWIRRLLRTVALFFIIATEGCGILNSF